MVRFQISPLILNSYKIIASHWITDIFVQYSDRFVPTARWVCVMFAELLACSNFSFLHGASHPEEMVETAHALGLSAIGICDRHGLYGSVRAFVRARELGIKLIVGTELEVKWRDLLSVSAQPRLALLVEDAQGYRNLCRLLTLAHRDAPKGQAILRLDTLRYEDFTGLIALVPADSLLVLDAAQQVHESATRQRQAWLARLHELFTCNGSIYWRIVIGMQRNPCVNRRCWTASSA